MFWNIFNVYKTLREFIRSVRKESFSLGVEMHLFACSIFVLCFFSCLLVLLLLFFPKVPVQGDGQFASNVSLIRSIGRGDTRKTQPKHPAYKRCMFLQDDEGFSKGWQHLCYPQHGYSVQQNNISLPWFFSCIQMIPQRFISIAVKSSLLTPCNL